MEPFDPWGKEPPPDDDHVLAEMDAAAQRARDIAREAYRLSILDLARRQVAKERQALRPAPQLVNLADFLTEPDDDPSYRIDGLWPTGGRVLVPAQFKAGKTTLVGNLIRALADGTPFLDTFGVRPASHIVLIDDELDQRVLRRWLRDHQIANQAAVSLVPLRGNVGAFDLLDPDVLATWAKMLTGADVVIIDCLRPILDALGLDENHDAGRFLVALDTLLADAGCSECSVIHHMGHSGERSRGDSRLNDWPDAIWKLVRDKDEEDPDLDDVEGARYFSAYGRDVEYPQSELTYDPETRHLSLGEHPQNRKVASVRKRQRTADEVVMKAVSDSPGLNKRALREASRLLGIGHAEDVDSAVERLVVAGWIWRSKAGSAWLHWPSKTLDSDSVSSVSNEISDRGTRPESVSRVDRVVDTTHWTHSGPPETLDTVSSDGRTPGLDTDTPTKPCPDCGLIEIAESLRRCQECAARIVAKGRAATA